MTCNDIYVKIKDGDKIYRIKAVWGNDHVQLTIIGRTNAWFADVTSDIMETLAKKQEIDRLDYFQNIKDCICNVKPNVSFNITNNEFVIYRNEIIKIKYFCVVLQQINYNETVENYIDDLQINMEILVEKLKTTQEEKLFAENKQKLCEQTLEEFVTTKQEQEKKLYSCFILTLNEKKKRIQYLTELLQAGLNVPSLKSKTKASHNTIEKVKYEGIDENLPRRREVISDSEESNNTVDDYNTDNEKDENVVNYANLGPSTSKQEFNFSDGDSSPPPTFSKRLKSDTKNKTQILNVGKSTDTSNQSTEESSAAQILPNATTTEQDTLSMDFTLQDILDRC